MPTLKELVATRQSEKPGRFCIGLDPDKQKIPVCIHGASAGIRSAVHMMAIVDATHDSAAAFKPQRAHWERLPDGEVALRILIAYIHTRYPGIPVILDCKRGDIGRTQTMYGHTHFMLDDADAVNFNPYMGSDCLTSLVEASAVKGTTSSFITLGRTSNPPAWQTQDARLANGLRVWEYFLTCAFDWAKNAGVVDRFGVVMGAAHDTSQLDQYNGTIAETEYGDAQVFNHHLYRAREIVGDDAMFLVPGIGAQKGHTEATLRAAYYGPGTVLLSSSSAITGASMRADYREAAAAAAEKQCQINAAIIADIEAEEAA
ncbi:MAG: orotidine-5'-phosphate decarboxylase [Candidatus Paceibacterota bacterium]